MIREANQNIAPNSSAYPAPKHARSPNTLIRESWLTISASPAKIGRNDSDDLTFGCIKMAAAISRAQLFRFATAVERNPAVDAWFESRAGKLGAIARPWYERMRECGDDVRELLHDGHPTACVGDAAFGYVNAFTAHVNVGFFLGAHMVDPAGLLEGTGKNMRHVKLRPGVRIDEKALTALIQAAYSRVKSQAWGNRMLPNSALLSDAYASPLRARRGAAKRER